MPSLGGAHSRLEMCYHNSIFQERSQEKTAGVVSLKVSLNLKGIKNEEKKELRTILVVVLHTEESNCP